MLVRFESSPISVSPLEVLFDRGMLFPELQNRGMSARRGAFPHVNIAEENDTIHVVAEIPGVPKDDIKINLQETMLTISGERKEPEENAKGAWVRKEIGYGTFERTFKLPYEVDASKVTAEYSNGILRVQLPKAEVSKPKNIVIQ